MKFSLNHVNDIHNPMTKIIPLIFMKLKNSVDKLLIRTFTLGYLYTHHVLFGAKLHNHSYRCFTFCNMTRIQLSKLTLTNFPHKIPKKFIFDEISTKKNNTLKMMFIT